MTQMSLTTHTRDKRKIARLALAWMLMLPLVTLAVHMQFSFLNGSRNSDDSQLFWNQMTTADDGVGIAYRVLEYGLYLILGWLIVTNLGRVVSAASRCKSALLVCGVILASSIWSQDFGASLHASRCYILDTLFAFYLLSAFSLEELMELMMMLGITLAVMSAFIIAAFPQYGLVHETVHLGNWQGIFVGKNVAAENFMFLLTPVCNRRILQPRFILYAGVMLFFIVMAHSVTALIVLPFYVAFMVFISFLKRMSTRSTAFVLAGALPIMGLSGLFVIRMSAQLSAFLGRDPSLTGRSEIWAILWQSVQKHPMLGYGYSAFWTGVNGEPGQLYLTLHWIFSYAHNGFLEVALQLGLIGVIAVVLMMVEGTRNAFQCFRSHDTVGIDWLIGLLFLTILYNLDEGTILYPHSLVSILFVMTCGGLAIASAQRASVPHRAASLSQCGARTVAYA